MRLYRRGLVWWCWFYDRDGNQVRISTRCVDREAASARAIEIEREAIDPVYARRQAAKLEDALNLLLRTRERQAREGDRSEATFGFYKQKVGHWNRILGADTPLARLGAEDVDRFVSTRRDEGMSNHTIAKELVALRVALKLSKRAGIWSGDPAEILPVGFSVEYKPCERVISWDDFHGMVARLEPDRAARVAFILATGARLSESEAAMLEDVGAWTVRLRGTKTDESDRVVPIVTEWQQSLLLYAIEHAGGTGGRLFRPWGKLHRDVARACRRAGCAREGCPAHVEEHYQCKREKCREAAVESSTPNDWRRTCATWLRTQGVALDLVGSFLGHSTDKITQIVYAHLEGERLGARILGVGGVMATVIDGAGFSVPLGSVGLEESENSRSDGRSSGTRTRGQRIKSPWDAIPEPCVPHRSSGARASECDNSTRRRALRRVS
jgi:integrase